MTKGIHIFIFLYIFSMPAFSVDWYFFKTGISTTTGDLLAGAIPLTNYNQLYDIEGTNFKCGVTEEQQKDNGSDLVLSRTLYCLIPQKDGSSVSVSIELECTEHDIVAIRQLKIEFRIQQEIQPSILCSTL